MDPLPPVADARAYEALWHDDAMFTAPARSILSGHGVHAELERYRSGTAVCYRAGELVLKLYPPFYRADSLLEGEVLERLAHVPKMPSPRPVARGEIDRWSYLLMTHLHGLPIETVWNDKTASERTSLMLEAGAIVRELHRAHAQGLPRADADWQDFRHACRGRALRHHAEHGFAVERTEELREFLADLDAEPELEEPQVLLHTELGPGHLLVQDERVTGLFDFGEARSGPAEYDLAAIGVFITRGDCAAFAAFLDGYGMPAAQRGPRLVRRLMRHALLHQYGHLTFYLTRSALPDATDLRAAAEHWFAHDKQST